MFDWNRGKFGTILATSICALFLVGGLAACGGGGGNGGGDGFNSSVSDDKKLSDLNQEERTELCESFTSWWESTKPNSSQMCRYSAHAATKSRMPSSDSEAQQWCSDAKSQCESQGGGSTGGSMSSCGMSSQSISCSETVGTYESCVQDYLGGYASTIKGLRSCSEATKSWYSGWDPRSILDLPSSCEPIQQNCPSLLGTGGGSSTGGSSGGSTSGGY